MEHVTATGRVHKNCKFHDRVGLICSVSGHIMLQRRSFVRSPNGFWVIKQGEKKKMKQSVMDARKKMQLICLWTWCHRQPWFLSRHQIYAILNKHMVPPPQKVQLPHADTWRSHDIKHVSCSFMNLFLFFVCVPFDGRFSCFAAYALRFGGLYGP